MENPTSRIFSLDLRTSPHTINPTKAQKRRTFGQGGKHTENTMVAAQLIDSNCCVNIKIRDLNNLAFLCVIPQGDSAISIFFVSDNNHHNPHHIVIMCEMFSCSDIRVDPGSRGQLLRCNG